MQKYKYSIGVVHDFFTTSIPDVLRLYRLSPLEAERITMDTSSTLEEKLKDQRIANDIKNIDGFVFGVFIDRLPQNVKARKQRTLLRAFNLFMDNMEKCLNEYLDHIVANHRDTIDNHLKGHPQSFSRNEMELWQYITLYKWHNYRKISDLMKLSANQFNLIKYQLITSCLAIYKVKNFKNFTH